MFRRITNLANNERGATTIIVALVLVVLLGFAALVVDAGVLLQERRHLQNAVDAAALAGAQQIAVDVTQATEQAYVYAERNSVSRPEVIENRIVQYANPGDAVYVRARRQVPLFFAPVLGSAFEYAEAEATAALCPLPPGDIWPWGITGDGLSIGGDAVLKVGSRESKYGNFMALDFPGSSGGSGYKDNIMDGYNGDVPGPIPPGVWTVDTETGNIVGPTIQGVSYLLTEAQTSPYPLNDIRNPQVGLVPILSDETWEDVRGKSSVDIIGFAIFLLLGVDDGGANGQGQLTVTGQYMGPFVYGVGDPQCGGPLALAVGAKLVK